MRQTKALLGFIAMVLALFAGSFVAVTLFAAGSADSPQSHEGVLTPQPKSSTVRYGDDPATFGQLTLPDTTKPEEGYRVVMLIHGGFWKRNIGDLSLMDDLTDRLTAEGFAVWNVEYGRVGERRGGWPHTFDHIGAAIDHVAAMPASAVLDQDKVVVIGHSAGGHLALWLRTRSQLAGEAPVVVPQAVVALAPIADLEQASMDGLGNGAVDGLLSGSPEEVPDRYEYASVRKESDIPALVIVSPADDVVPPRYSAGVPGAVAIEVDASVSHLELIAGDGQAIDAALRWFHFLQ